MLMRIRMLIWATMVGKINIPNRVTLFIKLLFYFLALPFLSIRNLQQEVSLNLCLIYYLCREERLFGLGSVYHYSCSFFTGLFLETRFSVR